jgi:hypothetical protein
VREEELGRIGVELRMEKLPGFGNINLAIFDAKVVAVNCNRRYGQTAKAKNGQPMLRGLIHEISCTCTPENVLKANSMKCSAAQRVTYWMTDLGNT